MAGINAIEFNARRSSALEHLGRSIAAHAHDSKCRVGPGNFTPSTGSPEAVTRPRLPQNAACRATALRSSKGGSQHSDFLQLPIGKEQSWSHSFRCYRFESCCHGWLIFSLHRRPNPPVEWSPCFRRTVHLPLAASPCSWLSQPRSTISQSDFRQAIGSPSPCRLVGPYKLRLNLTDLPCSYGGLWPHAGGSNPGSTPGHSP